MRTNDTGATGGGTSAGGTSAAATSSVPATTAAAGAGAAPTGAGFTGGAAGTQGTSAGGAGGAFASMSEGNEAPVDPIEASRAGGYDPLQPGPSPHTQRQMDAEAKSGGVGTIMQTTGRRRERAQAQEQVDRMRAAREQQRGTRTTEQPTNTPQDRTTRTR